MSQSGDGGYNGLKAFAFTVGVTVLIFTILYAARRYNPRLFAQEPSPRSRSWYLRGPNHPPDSDTRRPSLGERPRIWDARIASWYPPCSQPLSPSERLGPCQGQDENEKRDVNGAVDGEKKPQWAEFFPLSADKVSDADTPASSSQPKDDNTVRSTSSTQIQINSIILMPAPPRPTSLPSTSSSNSASRDTYDPPREYTLGTSYIPYTPGD